MAVKGWQHVPESNCFTLGCVQDLVSVRVTLTLTLLYPTLPYLKTAPVDFDGLHLFILLSAAPRPSRRAAAQAPGT